MAIYYIVEIFFIWRNNDYEQLTQLKFKLAWLAIFFSSSLVPYVFNEENYNIDNAMKKKKKEKKRKVINNRNFIVSFPRSS